MAQAGATIFGVPAFLYVTRETLRDQKIGTILGLVSNPFWWITMIFAQQWYMIPVHTLYTYGWIRKALVLFYPKFKTIQFVKSIWQRKLFMSLVIIAVLYAPFLPAVAHLTNVESIFLMGIALIGAYLLIFY